MNQNYNSVSVSNSAVKTGIYKNYILYGFMALVVLGCFLPFLTASAPDFGYKESINYVYTADEDGNGVIENGVYVIGLMIAAFVGIIKKKNYKGAIASTVIALALLAIDYFEILGKLEELTTGGLLDVYFGIGFYLVAIGLFGSLIMSFIINKDVSSSGVAVSNVNVTVNTMQQPIPQPLQQAQVMPQQPLTCSYCGGPRNDGLFCKSCGGKY